MDATRAKIRQTREPLSLQEQGPRANATPSLEKPQMRRADISGGMPGRPPDKAYSEPDDGRATVSLPDTYPPRQGRSCEPAAARTSSPAAVRRKGPAARFPARAGSDFHLKSGRVTPQLRATGRRRGPRECLSDSTYRAASFFWRRRVQSEHF